MPIFGTLDHFLEFLGAIVPLCSILSSVVNSQIRAKQAEGVAVSKVLLHTGSILNAASINLDKVAQIRRISKEQQGTVQEPSQDTQLETPPAVVEPVGVLEADFKALQEKVWALETTLLEMQQKLAAPVDGPKKPGRKKRL